MWRNLQRWWGVILIVVAVSATLWLGVTQQLVLYIHPRYVVFTVVMAALALILGLMSIAIRPSDTEETRVSGVWSKFFGVIALVLSGAVAVSLAVVPPATLSSATASQRDIIGSNVSRNSQNLDDVARADESLISNFTVVDWASLLRQTSDPTFYADKTAHLVGFITASEDDPNNIFYLSRFTVTCCAVDAQPTGVAVYAPNWTNAFTVDQWVEVIGIFEINPSSRSDVPLVLIPEKLSGVDRPREPYLY
jgi:putative membrane protein